MEFHVVIPARFASTRLPGKPLLLLAGHPMLAWVYDVAVASGAASVTIATDDARIATAAAAWGATVAMTRADHESGTDRLAEVVAQQSWPDEAVIVNLQGDEPLLPPALVHMVAMTLAESTAALATVATPITDGETLWNPHVVKVVLGADSTALYFSRAPIPYHRATFTNHAGEALPPLPSDTAYWRHIGLYAYRAATLRRWPRLAPSPLELAESLEQLRALHHGLAIAVATTTATIPAGVDVPSDVAAVEAALLARGPT